MRPPTPGKEIEGGLPRILSSGRVIKLGLFHEVDVDLDFHLTANHAGHKGHSKVLMPRLDGFGVVRAICAYLELRPDRDLSEAVYRFLN